MIIDNWVVIQSCAKFTSKCISIIPYQLSLINNVRKSEDFIVIGPSLKTRTSATERAMRWRKCFTCAQNQAVSWLLLILNWWGTSDYWLFDYCDRLSKGVRNSLVGALFNCPLSIILYQLFKHSHLQGYRICSAFLTPIITNASLYLPLRIRRL